MSQQQPQRAQETMLYKELKEFEQKRKNEDEDGFVEKDRRCLVYFLLFQWFIYIGALLAFTFGQPMAMLQPYDPDNEACGFDINVQGFPYIYFTTPDEGYLYRTVCVSDCPTLPDGASDEDESISLDCSQNSLISSCSNHPSVGFQQFQVLVYDSIPYKSVCLPRKLGQLLTVIEAARQPPITSHLHDFLFARYIILFSLFLCVFLNATFLKYLHSHTEMVVGLVFLFLEIGLAGVCGLGFQYSLRFENLLEQQSQSLTTMLSPDDVIFQAQARSVAIGTVNFLSIVFGLFFLMVPALICIYRRSLQRMINSLKLAAEFLSTLGEDLSFVPLMASAILVINFIIWFQTSLYLYSVGFVIDDPNQLPYQQFNINPLVYLFAIFHIFEILWTTSFIIGSAEYIHTSAYVLCYDHRIQEIENVQEQQKSGLLSPVHNSKNNNQQNSDEEEKEDNYIAKARSHFIFGHVGTAILGQVYISLFAPLKFLVVGCWKISKRFPRFCKFVRLDTCTKYCYLEKIGALTQNAFLFSYLKNDGFWKSSKDAHDWIVNSFEIEHDDIGQIGRRFTLLVQFSVSTVISMVVFILLTKTDIKNQISSPATTTLIASFFSYSITYLFASIYGSCIDVVYLLMKRDDVEQQGANHVGGGLNAPDTLRYLVSERER